MSEWQLRERDGVYRKLGGAYLSQWHASARARCYTAAAGRQDVAKSIKTLKEKTALW